MITRITGLLLEKKPPTLTVDVNGLGYEIHAPMSTFYPLPEIGNKVTLLTHFVVREDAQLLFGFYTEQERQLFRELIKVNGVGPKLALTILSGIEIHEFVHCIHTQNDARLTHVPGIGKKTAERLLIEMKSSLQKWETVTEMTVDANQMMLDAISALTTLGYKPADAKSVVQKIHEPNHSSEQLIRLALRQLGK